MRQVSRNLSEDSDIKLEPHQCEQSKEDYPCSPLRASTQPLADIERLRLLALGFGAGVFQLQDL